MTLSVSESPVSGLCRTRGLPQLLLVDSEFLAVLTVYVIAVAGKNLCGATDRWRINEELMKNVREINSAFFLRRLNYWKWHIFRFLAWRNAGGKSLKTRKMRRYMFPCTSAVVGSGIYTRVPWSPNILNELHELPEKVFKGNLNRLFCRKKNNEWVLSFTYLYVCLIRVCMSVYVCVSAGI